MVRLDYFINLFISVTKIKNHTYSFNYFGAVKVTFTFICVELKLFI